MVNRIAAPARGGWRGVRRAALLGFALLGLSGCVAYPVDGYYGPGYVYGPAPATVIWGGGYTGYYRPGDRDHGNWEHGSWGDRHGGWHRR